MAKTTGSKKLTNIRSFILFYVVFTIIYTCLVLFTSPLLITWGAKRTFFEQAYVLFLNYPFNTVDSLWLVLANAFVWALLLYAIIVLCISLIRRKSSAN